MRRWLGWIPAVLCAGALGGYAQLLVPSPVRHHANDLEVTGLPHRKAVYLSLAQLASLPQVAFDVADDENLPHAPGKTVHVEGVPLAVLLNALHAPADVLEAWCTDLYQAHYPASYLAAHNPVLALEIDGQTPAAWAAAHHAYDPSPYFITHQIFQPAFHILSHADEPQVPTNVIRLNLTDAAHAFGPITPPNLTPGSPIEQGFTIAKQNCLRCHFSGNAGGTKSGRDWQILSLWARQKPDYFTGYVHNPKSKDPKAQMPGFPGYDEATLNALLAYFKAFPAK